MTLTEFLLARIAEDEASAMGSQGGAWSTGGMRMVSQPEGSEGWEAAAPGWVLVEPHHVLAECDAKREIVRYYIQLCANAEMVEDPFHYHSTGLLYAVRTLAAIYADHPDYDEAWRP